MVDAQLLLHPPWELALELMVLVGELQDSHAEVCERRNRCVEQERVHLLAGGEGEHEGVGAERESSDRVGGGQRIGR